MNYYAVQVVASRESDFIDWVVRRQEGALQDARFFFPRRRLTIRRQGRHFQELYPVFPGYVFVEAAGIGRTLYDLVRHGPGFCRFLRSNTDIRPLGQGDLSVLVHFMGGNGIAESSRVYFNENERIVVVDGPMMGMEGNIVKVDRRKKRAKIRLDFASESFHLDLAFEVIERSSTAGAGPDKGRPAGGEGSDV